MQRQGSEPCELSRLDLESKAFDRQLIDQTLIEPFGTQDRRDRAEQGDDSHNPDEQPERPSSE